MQLNYFIPSDLLKFNYVLLQLNGTYIDSCQINNLKIYSQLCCTGCAKYCTPKPNAIVETVQMIQGELDIEMAKNLFTVVE